MHGSQAIAPRRRLQRGLASLVVAGAALAAAAATPAQAGTPVQRSLVYSCAFPLTGTEEVTFDFTTDLPSPIGGPTAPFAIDLAVSSPELLSTYARFGRSRLDGTALLTLGDGAETTISTVKVPFRSVDLPETFGPVSLTGAGSTPPLTFPTSGNASLDLYGLTLSLRLSNTLGEPLALGSATDSDGDRNTFDVPCSFGLPVIPQLASFTTSDPSAPPTTPATTPATAPAISRVSGVALADLGGFALITGSRLTNVRSVKVGGRSARFQLIGPNLFITAPRLPVGRYDVIVTTAAGSSTPSTNAKLRYISWR